MTLTTQAQKLRKIDKVGVVLRPCTPELRENFLVIQKVLTSKRIEVLIESNSANMIRYNERNSIVSFDALCQECDFLISMGGDGTLISVSRRSFLFNIPVMGVKLGSLGFLTDIMYDEFEGFISKLVQGEYRIDNRMVIEAGANLHTFYAFNDIVFTRKNVTDMLVVDMKVDGKLINRYNADGLVISTPTGSTAYNLSAGGPVVFPLTEAFIVTPVAPHSLTQRPLILPVEFEIQLSTPDKSGAIAIIDGQDMHEIDQNEVLKIKIASNKAKLIHRLERNYFEVLNEKLNWGK